MAVHDWMPPALYRAYAQARYGPVLKALQQNMPSPAGQVIVQATHVDNKPVYTPRRFDTLAREGYQGNVLVFRAVNIIATAIAGIPIRAYQLKGTGAKGQEVDGHPILDLLRKPNEDMAGPSFIERYVSFLLISGNSYIQALRPATRKAPPLQLDVLRPDRMKVIPGADGRVAQFEYAIGNVKMTLDKPDVLHSKMFSALDDWYGLSPIAVAARAVDIRNAGDDWNLSLLQNSGRPPGFFVAAQKLGDVQYNRMLAQLLDRYTGARMAGLPGLLEQGVDWKPSGLAPADMEWMALSREKGRDVAISMGVPSELLGDGENKTYSNYQEARSSLYTETVLPLFDRLIGDLNGWLPDMYDGRAVVLAYDRNDIEALQEDRAQVWQRIQKADFLTVDEKRGALGYDPYAPDPKEPGARILVLSTYATLEDVVAGTAKAAPALQADQPADQPADPNADPLDDLDAPAPSDAPSAPGAKGTHPKAPRQGAARGHLRSLPSTRSGTRSQAS